jgi:hypothetical protein
MLTHLVYPSQIVLLLDPCFDCQVLKFQCIICFLRSYIKVVVKFVKAQPQYANFFWQIIVAIKFIYFSRRDKTLHLLLVSAIMLSVILRST